MANKNIDSLFRKTKEIPSEIPFENLEQMILEFPNHPAPITETHWFVKLFNLKYIAMTILPLIALLIFMLVPEQSKITSSATETELKNASKKSVALPEISLVTEVEKSLELPPQLPIKTQSTTLLMPLAQKKLMIDLPDSNAVFLNDLPIIFDSVTPHKSNKSDEKQDALNRIYPVFDGHSSYYSSSSLQDISNLQLKKLRRTLYRNLKNDGILTNKKILVDMLLLPNQILINKQPIPEEFLLKYRDLTKIAGVGPTRKIMMNPEYILVGDFTDVGFKGHGFGRFTVKMIEEDNPLFQPNNLKDQLFGGDTIPTQSIFKN